MDSTLEEAVVKNEIASEEPFYTFYAHDLISKTSTLSPTLLNMISTCVSNILKQPTTNATIGNQSTDPIDKVMVKVVTNPIQKRKKTYKCEICQREFNYSRSLEIHIRTHTGERPYRCEICQKTFMNSSHLLRHDAASHRGEKPYKCEICDKTFSVSHHLSRHRLVHTGEKPYKCEICSKDFARSENLRKHMRIHTGEKPYKCEVCSKAFSRLEKLKAHSKIHTRAK